METTGNTFVVRRCTNVINGLIHGTSHAMHRVSTVSTIEAAIANAEQSRYPAAVTAGRTEPTHVCLNDADADGGVTVFEMVGGPEASKAATNDDDINIGVAHKP